MKRRTFDKILKENIAREFINANFILTLYSTKKAIMNDIPVSTLIQENFDTIIKNASPSQIGLITKVLCQHSENIPFITEHLTDILRYLDIIGANYIMDIEEIDFKSLVNQDITKVLDGTFDMEIIVKLYQYYSTPDNKPYFEEYFKAHPDDYIKSILRGKNYGDTLDNSEKYQDVYDLLVKMTVELLEEQNLSISDIEILNGGAFSNVIGIGDKILKYGSKRSTYNISNDKRIINPLIRVDLKNIDPEIHGTIEVMEKVDMSHQFTDEELYKLYKELRGRHIVCTDLSNLNVGTLLKPNKVEYSKSIADDPFAKGFDKEVEVLDKGEAVIIDTDLIFKDNDPSLCWGTRKAESFEERYQREKQALYYLEQVIDTPDIHNLL